MPHINELIDFTVEVFVVYKDKVLLRKHDKYNKWLAVGGHVELDENPNEAGIREVMEEVGLEVELDDSLKPEISSNETYQELIPPYFLNIHRINENHKHVTLVYFARAKSDRIKEGVEREKSEGIMWFSKEEIEDNEELMENIEYYSLRALEKLAVKPD